MDSIKAVLASAMEGKDPEEAVRILADRGISVDIRHDHGQDMLLLATENDWHAVASSIVIRARGLLNKETSNIERQQLAILLAAYDGNVEEFQQMMAKEALALSRDFRKVGETSLFLAVEQQNLAMTQSLLHLFVDVNAKDSSGQSALHKATRRKNIALVKLLLENNALVDCKDDCGRTPWSANVRLQDEFVLDVLRHAGADPSTKGMQGVSELYTAAKDGETDLVRFMLNSGTDPSIQTDYQWAPLHWAASYGHTECVRRLVEAGADVSVISDQRVAPLDLAIVADQHDAIAILTSAGAKEYKNIHVTTPRQRLAQLKEGSDSVIIRTTEALEQPESKDVVARKRDGMATDQAKLRLVYDKPLSRTLNDRAAVGQFVYMAGTFGPSENIYQISHLLEAQTTCISVRKAFSRAQMWDYPLRPGNFDGMDVLYDIFRSSPDYLKFELEGRHQNPLPGTIRMFGDRAGDWCIRHDHEQSSILLLRTIANYSIATSKDSRWTTESGTLLACNGWEDMTPYLCFEVGVERAMQDVIVTCWIAKLWSETVDVQRDD